VIVFRSCGKCDFINVQSAGSEGVKEQISALEQKVSHMMEELADKVRKV